MFFWFKTKKVFVDCFTDNITICDKFPIVRSSKTFPDWWKQLPVKNKVLTDYNIPIDDPTMKTCDGFVRMYRDCFTIPLWTDLNIGTDEDGSWAFHAANGSLSIDSHPSSQHGNFYEEFVHLKITPPWAVKSSKNIDFLFFSPLYSSNEFFHNIFILPGIVQFANVHIPNINLFLHKKNQIINLSAGLPLVMILPKTEHEVVVRCHFDLDNFNLLTKKTNGQKHFFVNSYNKVFNSKSHQSSGKCPFA